MRAVETQSRPVRTHHIQISQIGTAIRNNKIGCLQVAVLYSVARQYSEHLSDLLSYALSGLSRNHVVGKVFTVVCAFDIFANEVRSAPNRAEPLFDIGDRSRCRHSIELQ